MKKTNSLLPARRGPLSDEEKDKIGKWFTFKTEKEIARLLNRAVTQIERYIKQLMPPEDLNADRISDREEILLKLHSDPSWLSLQKQFYPDEIEFFENDFANYHTQFSDLTTSETKQVYQLITLDIKMQRHNIEEMRGRNDVVRMEKILEGLYGNIVPTEDDLKYIQHIEQQVMGMRAASVTRAKEYNDFLSKHQDILKSLKATRDQRIKSIEDRGKFISVLKELEIQENRNNINEMIGLTRIAVEKERARLSAPHQFADKVVDNPILEPQ